MARVLILSSWVAAGHVGLCAAVPALQALGHGVTQLPTTLLSNHPGWPGIAGGPVEPERLAALIDAIDRNGWLGAHDALLTGYLPTEAHVGLACDLVARVRARAPAVRVVVDPVLGDDPRGLYLPEAVAVAVRDRLAPLADVLTPNRFELAWLSGLAADTPERAAAAARSLVGAPRPEVVHVTSPPFGDDRTGVLSVAANGATRLETVRRPGVPHGVGDVFAAFVAAGLPGGAALGHLDALVRASVGAPHLRIAETAGLWMAAAPVEGRDAALQGS